MTPTKVETDPYNALLSKIIDSDIDDDFLKDFPSVQLSGNAISQTQAFSPELEAALEDDLQAEQYINNLKKRFDAAGLTDAMQRAMELLNEDGLSSGKAGEEDDDTDGSHDEPSTPTTEIQESQPQPKIAEGSISRLVNGVKSLVDIEKDFNDLRIQELDLPTTPESTIKAVLAKIYKLQEDLQIHLQGGPLANPLTLGDQRRRKVQELLEKVMGETALYEEFVNRAQYLSLDRILNESENSSDDELQDSELDAESEIHVFEDTLSDTSRKTISTSMTSMSPLSLRATDPSLHKIRSASSTTSLTPSRTSSRYSRSSSPPLLVLEEIGLSAASELEPGQAFRWAPLTTLSSHLYSTETSQNNGLPTVSAVSEFIAIGTTRGLVLVYNYNQNLRCVLGNTVNAIEYGAVTSLAISSDRAQIICGHAQGHIIIWDIARPNNPARTIMPISSAVAAGGRKEGHIRGSAILHVGFVGVRKNGIVSGDDRGMAFYHNLYKVMMVNATETIRILGRYPPPTSGPDSKLASKRPSTVFGLAPLPLGQSPHGSEAFGLVAMLTPFKMIIVSIKPTVQTQYKCPRPKHTVSDSHGPKSLSGCLAWFPAVKTRLNPDSSFIDTDPLLAFSWGSYLSILKVTVVPAVLSENSPKRRRPEKDIRLEFTRVAEWKGKHAIVGLQWLSHHILLILLSNEEIIVFDPRYMQESEKADVKSDVKLKSLVYHNRFSASLKETSVHPHDAHKPAVELAYYHSLRVYKGLVFLLGVREFYVGALLSWTDRILALVQSGDLVEAITLATSFYNGTTSQTILGLPDDEENRHAIVGKRLMELLTASLTFTFSDERTYDGMADEHSGDGTTLFRDLASACIEACLSMNIKEFLFADIYEKYEQALVKGVFLEVLGPYIIKDKIKDLPPDIMKDLVTHYRNRNMLDTVERCIWHINPQCLDIDQVVQLCQSENLYDALIYVWNRSMVDYVSPAVRLLHVIRKILILEKSRRKKNKYASDEISNVDDGDGSEDLETMKFNACKFYVYLENILTGRTYPNKAPLNEDEANEARTTLYSFVFSGRCVVWPHHGGDLILTAEDEKRGEPTYPYLRLFLRFDTKAFLKALEAAFEDSYLNGVEIITNAEEFYDEEEMPGIIINRQLLVNILLEVMTSNNGHSEFTPLDISYLYSFVARSLPKYPQFLSLPTTAIRNILVTLSTDTDPRTREERQLAVECLLSIYTPTDEDKMVELYENAGFWRVLEHVYKADQKYGLLVTTYLKDPERRQGLFDCIRQLLDPQSKLKDEQKKEVSTTVMSMIEDIVDIDGEQTARLIQTYFNGEHEIVIKRLESTPVRLFTYLRGLLEPEYESPIHIYSRVPTVEEQITLAEVQHCMPVVKPEVHEQYIALMCKFDPAGVYNYLQTHQDGTYRLEKVLPICDATGIVDAIVWILERSGNASGALDKVLEIVQERRQDIIALIEEKKKSDSDVWSLSERQRVETNLMKLKGVLKIGIQLCENSCRRATAAVNTTDTKAPSIPNRTTESETELLWFKLLDTFLDATKAISSILTTQFPAVLPANKDTLDSPATVVRPILPVPAHIANDLITTFKSYVQLIMRSLLLSTSSPYVSLPRLLLRFIQSQSKRNSTVADFRDIFVGMIDTYKYEGQLLAMTNRLFEKDLFGGVAGVVRQRGKGWRPRRGTCEVCGGQFWGTDLTPTASCTSTNWNSDTKRMPHSSTISNNDNSADVIPNLAALEENLQSEEGSSKSNAVTETDTDTNGPSSSSSSLQNENDLVLFRCGHGYHRRCLESDSNTDAENSELETKCSVCQTEKRHENLISPEIRRGSIESSVILKSKGKERV
ncbi:10453_t:CDS:10, partial [Paraglomus occultum]